ncbi:MAG: hypothetical protein JRI59_04610 [Deltaproteobacteria bacterium]|nr:hypothetical protein [Deltaproteobacteria bacterium]
MAHGLVLSAHPDLEVVSHSTAETTLTLLGFILDPLNPSRTSEDIVRDLAQRCKDLADLLAGCEPLSGRWALLLQNREGSWIFTDALGFRTVYYTSPELGTWCGSQPEIIKAAVGLEREDDEGLLAFVLNPRFARQESAWVGSRTIYKNCHRLLPNHFLKLGASQPVRFFPLVPLEKRGVEEIVAAAVGILQGSFAAITRRTSLTQPITSGWDSRVLLAASRHMAEHIEYYVDRQGALPENHPDIWVPARLTKKMGLNFVLKNSEEILPGWFVGLLASNVTGARVLPKTRMIYARLMDGETRVNINGNGSEVCRNYYESRFGLNPCNPSTEELAQGLGYPGMTFVIQELEEWRAGLAASGTNDVNILDLLMWEQDLGTWGAQYPAEQDLAVEEFSPFNCRRLLTTLLSAPRELRAGPHHPLYRQLIEAMWPELLAFPFNPPPKLTLHFSHLLPTLKQQLRPYLPQPVSRWLRKRRHLF